MKYTSLTGISALAAAMALLGACSQESNHPAASAQAAPVAPGEILGPKPGDVDEGPTPAERRSAWLKRDTESPDTASADTTPVSTARSSGSGEGSSRLK